MERVAFIEHRGKQVLIEDFSDLRPGDEARSTVEAARLVIETQPAQSVLALVDVTGSRFDADTIALFKDITVRNAPHMKAVAVVGIEGLLHAALLTVSRFSGRTFHTFKDRASALDWLAEQ